MQKILLFGAQGMLGMELFEVLQEDFEVIPFSRFNLDLTDTKKIALTIKNIKPEIVINASGFTNTEKAENVEFQEEAILINTEAPSEMAKICKKIGAMFIHFSTDFVFDGKNKLGYKEDSQKNPLNFYGLSKSKGEDLVQKNCHNFYIIRLAWLFGKHGPNFIKKMLHIAKGKNNIEVADDIIVSMSYAKDVAQSVKNLILTNSKSGVYHFINEGKYSLFEVVKMIFEIRNFNTEVIPVSYKNFPTEILRPEKAVLKNTKFQKLRPIKQALEDFLS